MVGKPLGVLAHINRVHPVILVAIVFFIISASAIKNVIDGGADQDATVGKCCAHFFSGPHKL